MNPRRVAGASVVVFGVALVVHAVIALQYRADPFASTYISDALSYHQWALRIAENGLAAEPVFHQSPLFPLLLAGIYALTPQAWQAASTLMLQILFGSAAIALLVPLGRLAFGSTASGIAAAGLALLYGPFVFYSVKLLPVAPALLTQAAGFVLLQLALRRHSVSACLLAGACWGLAVLTRAEMLLFVPLALLALWSSGAAPALPARKRLAGPLAYLAALALLMAPATAHNLLQGDFVLVAASGGENLFIGNQRGAGGGYTPLDAGAGDIFAQQIAATRIAERERGRQLKPSEISAYWRARALTEIRADPQGWGRLELAKLGRTLHPGDPTDIYSFPLERRHFLQSLYLLGLSPWALLALGAVGFRSALRETRPRPWLLVGLVAVQLIVLLVFFVDARLRLPLFFFLCPFAGCAVVDAVRRWRTGRRSAVIALAVLVGAGLAVGTWATRPTPRDVVRLASVLSTQERLDESLSVLEPLVRGPNADPIALDQAGWVLQKRGDHAAARDRYLRALDRDLPPGRARQTRTRLAQVYESLGRFDEAAAQHDAAVASGHANAGTFYERGMYRLRRRDRDRAVEDLRQAARIDPAWPAPRVALHWLGLE